MSDEHFGTDAQFRKDTPQTLANTLRVMADAIEDAPNTKRYDANIEINEFEYVGGRIGIDYEDADYNDLKQLAAQRGLEVGHAPEKQTLVTVLEGTEE